MQRRKITFGNQQASFDEGTVKRGYRLKQRALHLLPAVVSSKQKTTVSPGVLAALGVGMVFLFFLLVSDASVSTNDVRRRLPKLHEQYVSYQMNVLGSNQALADQRWQIVERLLDEIAHHSQAKNQEQMGRKLEELLAQEPDKQNPVYRFCNELRTQMAAW